ncbi:MAG: hypothetical protein FWF08_05375 [Oscillospiraceae bacterium]|nr:hypothetical protein [Oscillospiraceae bacterium]
MSALYSISLTLAFILLSSAVAFGHYHMTDSTAWFRDICIIQSPGASLTAYGHVDVRGVRVITIDENTLNFETEVVKFKDIAADYDGLGLSFWQRFMQMFREIFDAIKTVFKFGA